MGYVWTDQFTISDLIIIYTLPCLRMNLSPSTPWGDLKTVGIESAWRGIFGGKGVRIARENACELTG
jgi:hypothetical protein